jgi:hypothetical protein
VRFERKRKEVLLPAVSQSQLARLTVTEIAAIGAITRVVGVFPPCLAVSHLGRKVVSRG